MMPFVLQKGSDPGRGRKGDREVRQVCEDSSTGA